MVAVQHPAQVAAGQAQVTLDTPTRTPESFRDSRRAKFAKVVLTHILGESRIFTPELANLGTQIDLCFEIRFPTSRTAEHSPCE
jgi:hypothetical protein